MKRGRSRRVKDLLRIIFLLLLLLVVVHWYHISRISSLVPGSLFDVEHNKNIEFQEDDDFQKVTDHPEKLYLYSAYFDHIDKSIKLIGGGKVGTKMPVYCQFYNYEKSSSHRLGQIVDIKQINSKKARKYKYKVVWVRCPIMTNDVQLPKYVSINLYPHFNATSICTGPTYSYDSPLRFLEWIEFYKLMGVRQFIFTNVSIGPSTSCLMRQYQLNDEAVGLEILKWNLGFEVDAEIYLYGNAIQNNDCIYRTRGLSQYVISVDLDEMIIPSASSNVSNYMDFVGLIENQKPASVGQVSAYLFNNGFFVPEAKNPENTGGQPLNLSSDDDDDLESQIYSKLILSTRITRGLKFYTKRSKYIANPNLVVVSHLHWVWESQPGTQNYEVPPELGYLHHYRNKLPPTIKIGSTQIIIDKSGQRYAKQISAKVAEILRKYGKMCNIL